MFISMWRWGLLAFFGFAMGCGRSDLNDELSGLSGGDDTGFGSDGGAVTPVADSSNPKDSTDLPPYDARPPYYDVFVPPPDVRSPPYDAREPPPDGPVYFPDGGCGPSTCTGCCMPDGSCDTAANSPSIKAPPAGYCGSHGEQCIYCNQFCLQGGCGAPVGNCSASNCDGCCVGNGICADGKHDTACGHGGIMCEGCNPTSGGGHCILEPSGSGGHCQFAPKPCDQNSCPNGCCAGNICAQGTQDIACGTTGGVCVDCTTTGTTCLVGRCAGGFPANGGG
jgi:hypothetical protein